MPVGEWLTGALAGDFRESLESVQAPFLDRGTVREVFDAHRAGRADHAKFLWSVYVYGRWERRLRDRGIPLGLDG